MQIIISPGKLSGNIRAISSKSIAHRMLICAAFSDNTTEIFCPDSSDDIDATISCLNTLGASIVRSGASYMVTPIVDFPKEVALDCRESGSTLRFLLPLVGAFGISATFLLRGRLPMRPLSPLWEEMERMGCSLSRPTENSVRCTGHLKPGAYSINGSVSSQFITGLLLALSVLPGKSTLKITGELQSKPYVDITKDVLSLFGINTYGAFIEGRYPLNSPSHLVVEGDWSNAAFFLVANALGSQINISNLNLHSYQGDRRIIDLISFLETGQEVNLSQVPDLMPILCVLAAKRNGAVFTNIQRLRLKESDRVQTVQEMLHNMGVQTSITGNTFTVFPGSFNACTVNSHNDHRIAMAAAIAATTATGQIKITNAECVSKSYPAFWEHFAALGGNYEQLEG